MMTGPHTQNRRAGAASDPSHPRSADRAALVDESAELSIRRRSRRPNSRRATTGAVPVHFLSQVRAVYDERAHSLRVLRLGSCRVPPCPPKASGGGRRHVDSVIVPPTHRARIAAITRSAPRL